MARSSLLARATHGAAPSWLKISRAALRCRRASLVARSRRSRSPYLFLDRERFHASFAGDLPAAQAAFMADSQVPWGVGALEGAVTEPAWRVKPSWYLVARDDRMIPPPAQRAMAERAGATVTEVPGRHSVYLSQAKAVASFIEQAVG